MPVYMIQLLCPKRHTLFVVAYEAEADFGRHHEDAGDYLEHAWEAFRRETGHPACCGTCRSTDLTYEQSRTKFTTMAEAQPHLEAAQAANEAARAAIDLGRRRVN